MNEPADETLIAAHLAGDARAFGTLVERYERRVFAIALRMCGEAEAARDVTQEVFVAALRSLEAFAGRSQLSTWLHRVAVNASLDRIRRTKRRAELPLAEGIDPVADSPNPEEAAVAADRARAVHRAIAALSPEFRAVIVLHDLQGLDYAEVAKALDAPLGTIKSRIHRARLELARMLGHLREPAADVSGASSIPPASRRGEPTAPGGPLT